MPSGIPGSNEYNPYYQGYIGLVENSDIIDFFKNSYPVNTAFYESITPEKWDYKYASGKWSVKGVLQHIIDTERIFAYRLLRISRNDSTPLAGFDQNAYADDLDLSHRSAEDLIADWKAVRNSTIWMLEGLKAEDWDKMGTASDAPVSVRALAYMIAGHESHHLKIVEDKYLS